MGVFERVFPFYLSIGMSYEQFWDGEPELAIYYRKAHQQKIEEGNMMSWLQGRYFYEAMASVMSAMFGKGKAHEYPKEPYPLNVEDSEEIQKRKEIEAKEQAKAWMEMLTKKRYPEKEE